MNERTIAIGEYLTGNHSIAHIARVHGISRKTLYKWIERYQADPVGGLKDRSRAPHHHPNALSEELVESILRFKAKYPLWGAPKIHSKLRHEEDCPAESTVSNVLKRYGVTRRLRRRAKPLNDPPSPLHGLRGPNQLWCADFKGYFHTGDGRRCDPLTITDAYSRYLLCCQGIAGSTGLVAVKPIFEAVFREYGLPRAIRTDNGAPFASNGLGRLSQLSVWWLRLGIELDRIQPGHPEQNSRHERMHRTLNEEAITPPRANHGAQQKGFDEFRHYYNHERPHEGLNQNPPAAVYTPSLRDYPTRLAEPEYADMWQKRSVRSNGEIKWQGRKFYLTQALVDQWVGMEPVAEGQWRLWFMNYELGILDEKKGRVLGVGGPKR